MSHRSYKIYKSYHFYLFAVVCAPLILAAVFSADNAAQAAAGINSQFNYQGKLTNSSGAAVSDGAYNFVFKLYTVSSGGSAIWTETWNATTRFTSTVTGTPPSSGGTSVTYVDDATESYLAVGDTLYNNTAGDEVVIEAFNTTANTITISPTSKAWAASDSITTKISSRSGLFSARLGSITSLSSIDLNQTPLYLGVAVGADSEMTPRKIITAVLQAFQANKLDGILNSTSTTGVSEYGSTITISDTGIVTTGTDTTYGLNISLIRTGASGGTINSYGVYSAVTADNAGAGTSTAIGGYFSATGADNNYGLIVENGNVGIGDATPDYLLDVAGTLGVDGNLTLTGTAANIILGSNYLSGDGGDEGIFVNSTGDVGIGTNNPGAALQINRNSTSVAAIVRLRDDNEAAGSWWDLANPGAAAGSFGIVRYESSTSITSKSLFITSGGNYGVGDSGPAAKLSVNGNVVIGTTGATGPANGLYVVGNTGLNVQSPANQLDVGGALSVGLSYGGTAAPTNGAIIEGSVGIGTTSASAGKLVIAQTDAANLQAMTIDTEESTGTQNVFSVISDSGSNENTVLNLTAAGNLSIDGSLTTGGASTVYADGSITKSTGSALSINLGGAAGDDFIVDTSTLVVESDNDRVGIGTTGPSAMLHIEKNIADYVVTKIRNPNTGGTTFLTLQNDTIETDIFSFGSAVPGNFGTTGLAMANLGILEFGARGLISTVGNNQLYLSTNRFVRMTIDGSGNIGIGTTSPSHKLQITDTDTTASRAGLYVAQSGAITGTGYGIYAAKTGASTTNVGGYFSASGATNNYGLIVENGNVGIGTASPNQGKLEVKGDTVCVDTNSDDNATSCITSESDARLKTNIAVISGSLDIVSKLRGVSFDWKVDDPEVLANYPLINRFASNPHSAGLIAQEVETVFPLALALETVGGEARYLQLDYQKFTPLMIEAIKELNEKVEELKKKVSPDLDSSAVLAASSAAQTSGTSGGDSSSNCQISNVSARSGSAFGGNCQMSYWLINSSTGRLVSTLDLDLGGKSIYNIGGLFASGGKWKLAEDGYLEIEKIIAKEIETEKLKIGALDLPAGITLYDLLTKEPYCLYIENGEIKKQGGECDNQPTDANTEPINTNNNETQPATDNNQQSAAGEQQPEPAADNL